MIRKAVGIVITRTAVAATTNRTRGRLADRKSTTNGPRMMTVTTSPASRARSTGTTVNRILPGRVSRSKVRLRVAIYLSTPPMIGSSDEKTAIMSATRLPGSISESSWRFTNDGSWIRIRNGWSVPSLTA